MNSMANKDKKRKHRYYRQKDSNSNKRIKISDPTEEDSSSGTRLTLQDHLQGFLITCNQKEYQCLQESYNLLNEIIDKINLENSDNADLDKNDCNGQTSAAAADPNDIEACIQQEIGQQKIKRKRLIQVKTKCKNLIFININQDDQQDNIIIDPNEIVLSLFKSLEQAREQNCRHIQRIIPIIQTCRAEKTLECFERIFEERAPRTACSFAVQCRIRNNSSFKEKMLLEQVVVIVREKRPNWLVNLDRPDQLIMIQIVCKAGCISLLTNYYEFAKYNLIEFAKRIKGPIKEKAAEKNIDSAEPLNNVDPKTEKDS